MRKIFLSLAMTGAVLGLSACDSGGNNISAADAAAANDQANADALAVAAQANALDAMGGNETANSSERSGTRERTGLNEQ